MKGVFMKQLLFSLLGVVCLLLSLTVARAAGKVAEVDDFHKVLHPLVHEAYPNKDFNAIRAGIPDLLAAANTMAKAVLPSDLAPKQKEYKNEVRRLVKQLKEMDKKKGKLSDDELGKKFMAMHDTFEKIMEIVQ